MSAPGNGADASTDSSTDAPSTNDGGADAGPNTCAWDAMFNTPVPLPGLDPSATEGHPSLLPNELTIYFHGGGGSISDSGNDDLFVATRTSRTAPFGAPVALTISTAFADANASISHDDSTIYFDSTTIDSGVHSTLFFAKKPAATKQFPNSFLLPSPPAAMGSDDGQAFITADDVELWFTSRRDGGTGALDIYSSLLTGGLFGPAVEQSMLNSTVSDYSPSLSFDRLTVYLASARSTVSGPKDNDIFRSHRTTVNDAFPTPLVVPDLSSTADEFGGWLSPDNCRFYFETKRSGKTNIYVAERAP